MFIIYYPESPEKYIKRPFRTPVKSEVHKGNLGNWRDKAGGYGIQESFGAMAVRRIEGDYYNVMGLPVSRLYQTLKDLGVIENR